MSSPASVVTSGVLAPTLRKQCIGFMIGSALFALGSAPGFGTWAGANAVNFSYFIGAWFFTAAALMQLAMSGSMTTTVSYGPGVMFRAPWLAAATQFFGTLLFNMSTSEALGTHTSKGEAHLIWTPNAAGSVAFLVSGWFVLVAYNHDRGTNWNPRDRDWWSGQINFIGCIAFGVSAVASFITKSGVTVDAVLANVGTFVGAVCFFLASAVVLPRASASAAAA